MPRRVVIVEDEQIVAADLEHKLQRMGYEVAGIAASGEEGISLANQWRPDVVLMDIQLRGEMSGIEAAHTIQTTTGAHIIFVTAFAGMFMRKPGLMSQPGICLAKPFSENQIRAALEAIAS